MARTCPVDLDTSRLRAEIESIYRRVATEPSGDFHFHRGPTYAVERLGYDPVALARLPADSTASFAGVANPHRIASMTAGATVVDIGCGAGMDLLLAAESVGPDGRAIGVDMTEAMAERARNGAPSRGLANVEVRLGDAMSLPVESASVDIVISNGVLNLTPDKDSAFGEVCRILKPGESSCTETLSSRPSCRSRFVATSICGPVESPALCRRQSLLRFWGTSASTTSSSRSASIVFEGRRRKAWPGNTASSA